MRESARYDALSVEQVLAGIGALSRHDLAKLRDHERRHQNRSAVLAGIDSLESHEPWVGYDELDEPGVRSGLDAADRRRLDSVLAYERGHKNRAGILLAVQQHLA